MNVISIGDWTVACENCPVCKKQNINNELLKKRYSDGTVIYACIESFKKDRKCAYARQEIYRKIVGRNKR